MAMKYSCRHIFATVVLAVLIQPTLMAAPPQPLRIVELFTSHGCSSCPPADRLLGELLAEDPSLMALEFHVDYWNSLVHGGDGSWTDPFSSREFTHRQREYNDAELTGQRGVYTPQAVVNGHFAAVGSDRRRLRQALGQTGQQQLVIDIVEVPASGGRELNIRVSGSPAQLQALSGTAVSLVRYIDSATTPVTGGENKDLELVNHHIVFEMSSLGEVNAQSALNVTATAPIRGEGCVVLVQDGAVSPIYAAAECP